MDLKSYITKCKNENLPIQIIVNAENPFFIQGFIHKILEERIIIYAEERNHEVLIADILGFPQQDI